MRLSLLFTLSILIFGKSDGQINEEELIQKTFNNYKTAILNDKAEDALHSVDSRTIAYYTYILDDVKNADSIKLESMSLIDKLTVLIIRSKATKAEIRSMNGIDLFTYAVKNGMVGKNSVINTSVGKVVINSNFATGELLNNNATTLSLQFYKEEGNWKLNLTSLFPASNMEFKKMIEESGKNENDYIFMLLEIIRGKRPGVEIWKPIITN